MLLTVNKIINRTINNVNKEKSLTLEDRKQRALENRKHLKAHFHRHKKAYLVGLILGAWIGGTISIKVYDYLFIDKLDHELLNSNQIVECFYNAPCKEKISNLNLTTDKDKINAIALAYSVKDFIIKYPERYEHASPDGKSNVDNLLKLTN